MQRSGFNHVAASLIAILAAPQPVVSQQVPVLDRQVTIEQAVAAAFEHHPQLRAARADVASGRGTLRGAEIYPFNPKLQLDGASRSTAGRTEADWSVRLSQEIELPAKRRRRVDTAKAGLSVRTAGFDRQARILAARVHTAFVTTLEARDLLGVARAEAEVAGRVHDLAQRRLRRGATTQLELNLAEAELGRAEGRLETVRGTYQTSRAELAETLGVSPLQPPVPSGDLEASELRLASLDELASTALENRADVLALRAFEQQSSAAHQLARISAWPNLTLGAVGGREFEEETIIGGRLAIPLPIFQRNQGQIAIARAEIERARAQRERGELVALRELAATYAAYQAASNTAKRLRARVFGTMQDNLKLLEKAFAAGKTTWSEVLVIRRSVIDAERELIGAEATARRAWIALQLAAGRMPVPGPEDQRKETTP